MHKVKDSEFYQHDVYLQGSKTQGYLNPHINRADAADLQSAFAVFLPRPDIHRAMCQILLRLDCDGTVLCCVSSARPTPEVELGSSLNRSPGEEEKPFMPADNREYG